MRPKVSVIIPCYNYDKYIEHCILSVVVQKTSFPFEIIIGDDNSSDNSFLIAQRMQSTFQDERIQFKVYKNEENIGEINNTKKLLQNSTGQYVAYLDADDYWTFPNKLQTQVEFMDQNPNYSLCITGFLWLQNGQFIPKNDFTAWLCPIDTTSESLTKTNTIGSSSSRLFRNYNNLIKDYFVNFPYSDWPLNFELSLLGDIKYLDFPSYVYRIHDKSLSHYKSAAEKEKQEQLNFMRSQILEKILDDITKQKNSLSQS